MKVILKQEIDRLGDAGDIVEVADGYGNNFLLPRGLAMRATRGAVKDAEAIRTAHRKREARTLAEAQEMATRLSERPVTVQAKAGEDGTLYGSVGNAAIADAISGQLHVPVDRRRIRLDKPFKELGTHEVNVRVHKDVAATVRVEIVRLQ